MTDAMTALLSSVRLGMGDSEGEGRRPSCPAMPPRSPRDHPDVCPGSAMVPTSVRQSNQRSGTVMVAPAASVSTAGQRRTLLVASASTLLVLVTFVTPLATGIRTAAALGAGTGGQAWLLSAMSVGLAAALLVAGEAADQLGRRRIFVAGLVLLGIGAAISGLAGGTGVFLAGRLLEGLGGAGVLACSLGLLSAAFPPGPSRANAMAGWGASVGAGTGLGGMLTVLLDPGTGWRTTYLVTVGLALLLAGTARIVVPDLGVRARRRVDVVGPVLLVAALGVVLVRLGGTRDRLRAPAPRPSSPSSRWGSGSSASSSWSRRGSPNRWWTSRSSGSRASWRPRSA